MFSFPGAPRRYYKYQRKNVCKRNDCAYYRESYQKEILESAILIEQDNKKIEDLNKLVAQLKAEVKYLREQDKSSNR